MTTPPGPVTGPPAAPSFGDGAGPKGAATDDRISGRAMPQRGRSITAVTGIALLILGIGAAGFSAGWVARTQSEKPPAPTIINNTITAVDIPAAQALEEPPPVQMPDVRGLTKDDAVQALADAGVAPDHVTAENRPWATDPGYVIAQAPIAGSVDPRDVTIYLPVPAVAPDLTGKSESAAAASLEQLGAVVSVRRQYDPATAAGQVIRSAPEAGKPLTPEATIFVGTAPASVALTDLRDSGDCGAYRISMNGTEYDPALACRAQSGGTTGIFMLNRGAHTLTAVAGVDDDNDPGDQVRIIITGDAAVIFDQTLGYGTTAAVNVDVSNVLRLEVTMIAPDTDHSAPFAVLAEAQLLGGADELATMGRS